jgi:hypothetical protein
MIEPEIDTFDFVMQFLWTPSPTLLLYRRHITVSLDSDNKIWVLVKACKARLVTA